MKRWMMSLLALTMSSVSIAKADVQPVPAIGQQITITDGGRGQYCFDTLENLKLTEKYLGVWSGDKMDAYLAVHEMGFYGGEKAKVLALEPTYLWADSGDRVKPIQLLIEKLGATHFGRNLQGHTCWWEFSQNPDTLPQFFSWK